MGRKEAVSGGVICLAVALLQVVWQPKKREMDVISSVSMNNGDQIREYIVEWFFWIFRGRNPEGNFKKVR